MKIAVKFLIALGLSLLLVWAVRTYAFTVFTVPAGGLPPHLEEGNRVIVNRIDCDFFNRGELVVYADTVVHPLRNQRHKQVFTVYFPTICCKRCGCKDCRFYLLQTSAGQQLVHKHQMIGKAYRLF